MALFKLSKAKECT